jgi:tRNA (guanosine-2'-O-)-methyltransferase
MSEALLGKNSKRNRRLEDVARRRQLDLTVVVENIHDPHNVSAILRTCDSTGVHQVQLVYTTEDFPRIGKKSSASAGKWVSCRKFNSVAQCYKTLRAEGFAVWATRPGDASASLYGLDLRKKVAVVLGNEHRGVSDEAASLADGVFKIPMFGMIQSLNVSVACAVVLYEAVRQRITNGSFDGTKASPGELAEILEGWRKK